MTRSLGLFRFVIFFSLILACAVPPRAMAESGPGQGESFSPPTYRDLVQTFLMMQGLDINKDKIADEYAKLSYCSLYKKKFHNDFSWNKIRSELITRVNQKRDYYRVQYQLEGTIYLGRFNFENQQFPLIKDSAINHIGALIATDPRSPDSLPYRLCGDHDFSSVFPYQYIFELNRPFSLKALKVSQDEAKALLDKLASLGDTDRRLYVRFRYRIQTVDKIDPFGKGFDIRGARGSFHGELTSVDLFLDHDMTKFYMRLPLK
ncbi:MAG: DUF4852 domain-containing protein [Alphaproteobacteria bacterium]|nr:DUF4852 domain-containing protein [Alphaproteobacteria bacterium]